MLYYLFAPNPHAIAIGPFDNGLDERFGDPELGPYECLLVTGWQLLPLSPDVTDLPLELAIDTDHGQAIAWPEQLAELVACFPVAQPHPF